MKPRALARALAIATVVLVAACGGTTSGGGKTTASVAIVPGGPHPYFEPMRQAIVDAKADFNLKQGTFEVPTDWKQDLQNQLLTSLAAKGYDGFGIFPTDGNAANGIVSQLAGRATRSSRSAAASRNRPRPPSALPPTSALRPTRARRRQSQRWAEKARSCTAPGC